MSSATCSGSAEQLANNSKDSSAKHMWSAAMSSDTWNLFSSGSAARPAHRPQDSSAAQLAGAAQRKRIRRDGKGQDRKGKDAATSLSVYLQDFLLNSAVDW